MFSLESPHREYTQHTIFNIKQKPTQIISKTIMSAAMEFFLLGLQNEFEIAVVNEPSVFGVRATEILLY